MIDDIHDSLFFFSLHQNFLPWGAALWLDHAEKMKFLLSHIDSPTWFPWMERYSRPLSTSIW